MVWFSYQVKGASVTRKEMLVWIGKSDAARLNGGKETGQVLNNAKNFLFHLLEIICKIIILVSSSKAMLRYTQQC